MVEWLAPPPTFCSTEGWQDASDDLGLPIDGDAQDFARAFLVVYDPDWKQGDGVASA